ncbi:MAG: hypothetical protein GX813_04130, partial [Erysipelotrichia bacterium]|nr:hypothetical protein [Erysipelotrichia bacterium]
QDDISKYIAFINSLPGNTFKNKVYNVLLAIGLTPEILNAVINNMTDGPTAANNNAGQIIARAENLTGSGTTVRTDTSDRNHPDKYFTLGGTSQTVSYTFNAPKAFSGQLVAYLGKSDNSSSKKIANAISLQLNNSAVTIKDITNKNAGMGVCGKRTNYFPVVLADINFSAGNNTIKIAGSSEAFNIGGIYVFNKAVI